MSILEESMRFHNYAINYDEKELDFLTQLEQIVAKYAEKSGRISAAVG